MIDFDWDLFHRRVPTLQDLIIDQMVRRFWHDEMILKQTTFFKSRYSYDGNGKDNETSADIIFDLTNNPLFNISKIGHKITSNDMKLANSICIASQIEYMIKQRILKMETEIINWLRYHREEVFKGPIYHNRQVNILKRFDEITYDNNCRINYKKTARKMLACRKFSVMDKFMIASAYCFGNEIRLMWPAVSRVLHRYEFSFDLYPLPYYWRCQMTNRLNEMPIEVQRDLRRICPLVGGNIPAWEFFYDILIGRKVNLDSIDNVFRCAYPQSVEATMKKCFPSLSDDDLKYVFSKYGSPIMIRLMTTPSLRKFVLPLWLRVNHIIDGDTLLRIFQEILKQEPEKIVRFLSREIWHHTSSELRSYVVNYFQHTNSFNEFRTSMYDE